MTATPYSQSHAGYASHGGRGFFRRLFDRMVAAQEEKARRIVATHLAIYSDAQLDAMGFDRKRGHLRHPING